MKKLMLSAFVFSSCFAYQPINKTYLQNKINLNTLKTEYPELRELKIKLVPEYSSNVRIDGDFYPATYNIGTKTLSISQSIDPFILKHAVCHEYGHAVYYNLPNYLIKYWERLFRKNPVYVSEYSRINAEENFAEWYTVLKYGTREGIYKDVNTLFSSPQALFINNLK